MLQSMQYPTGNQFSANAFAGQGPGGMRRPPTMPADGAQLTPGPNAQQQILPALQAAPANVPPQLDMNAILAALLGGGGQMAGFLRPGIQL
jgi:hypothetical protein